jgi:hypothetical protein
MTRRTSILPRLTFAVWWDVPRATLLDRLGAPPQDAWYRPVSHPITGHFTPSAGEPCTSHVPGGRRAIGWLSTIDARRRERHRAPPSRHPWGDQDLAISGLSRRVLPPAASVCCAGVLRECPARSGNFCLKCPAWCFYTRDIEWRWTHQTWEPTHTCPGPSRLRPLGAGFRLGSRTEGQPDEASTSSAWATAG